MNAPLPIRVPLLELDLLRTLVAIAESGNFSAAAEAVGRTPSAISLQVKRMEEVVGRPLFLRESRTVRLTRAGEMVLEHARRVLALNRDMIARFVAPEILGEVRLGAPDDVAERFMPEMLRQFANRYPGISVKMVIDHSDRMIEMVEQGRLDLTVITAEAGIRNDPGGAEIIYREPLVWAGLSGGIAVEQDPLPLAVWEPHCLWRQSALSALDAVGRAYRIVFESAHASGQRAAILADLAIAQIPVSSLGGRIVEIPPQKELPALPPYALGLVMTAEPSEPVAAAADHLRRSFRAR